MDITLDNSKSRYIIRACSAGKISINEETYTQSLIVTLDTLIHPWKPQNFEELSLEDLSVLFSFSPEIILIGTGMTGKQLHPEWLVPFYQKHIGVEVMTTPAACRTFNVLASEGRKVAAGLTIV